MRPTSSNSTDRTRDIPGGREVHLVRCLDRVSAITLDIFDSHLLPDMQEKAAKALEEALQ